MRIYPVSDTHCKTRKEWMPKDRNSYDMVIHAGDFLTTFEEQGLTIFDRLEMWANKYKDKELIYVPGNHDYFEAKIKPKFVNFNTAMKIPNNLSVLDNSVVYIVDPITEEEIKIIGTTYWYDITLVNDDNLKSHFADFRFIEDWAREYEKECLKSKQFIEDNMTEGCIVVTHHTPSWLSVHPRFKMSNANMFFTNPQHEELIQDTKPKLWIHGHTHDAFDYKLGDTRIVCNPYGYPFEVGFNGFNKELIVEI